MNFLVKEKRSSSVPDFLYEMISVPVQHRANNCLFIILFFYAFLTNPQAFWRFVSFSFYVLWLLFNQFNT